MNLSNLLLLSIYIFLIVLNFVNFYYMNDEYMTDIFSRITIWLNYKWFKLYNKKNSANRLFIMILVIVLYRNFFSILFLLPRKQCIYTRNRLQFLLSEANFQREWFFCVIKMLTVRCIESVRYINMYWGSYIIRLSVKDENLHYQIIKEERVRNKETYKYYKTPNLASD